jgi:hypothetical protein
MPVPAYLLFTMQYPAWNVMKHIFMFEQKNFMSQADNGTIFN